MKTAVEWLEDNLIFEPWAEEHFKHNSECWDKAKQMEKEQIEKAFEEGMFHYTSRLCPDEYYNKTFKSEE
jgi:hypothetical protein